MKNAMRATTGFVLSHSRWIPVAGAVVYVTLWALGEVSRWHVEDYIVLALFASAIALSGFFPLVSLGTVTAIPVLQLMGLLAPPTANGWPVYLAAGFVALAVAFSGEGLSRTLVLPAGVLASVLFAARMMLPSEQGYWTEWIGGMSVSNYPHKEGFAAIALVACGFYVGMWALGLAARSLLRERAMGTALHRTDFELRLAGERARISRDVHDALAHSLAVIVSQAEGAQALQSKRPQVASEALSNITSVARVALTDVRNLVERIHSVDDLTAITPTIGDLVEVIARVRTVGMDATLQVLGEPRPLAPSRELAVFRIVQESLTNALKHAGATSSARVTLDWRGPGLAVLVVSRPDSEASSIGVSSGVGIAGMKERARLAGGWLTAAPEGATFLVTAFIPVAAHEVTRQAVDA